MELKEILDFAMKKGEYYRIEDYFFIPIIYSNIVITRITKNIYKYEYEFSYKYDHILFQ